MQPKHSPALVRRVLDMWGNGKTGGEIGAALGLTRGSVMGLIHRQRKMGEKKAARVGERNKFPSKKEVERKQVHEINRLYKKTPPPPEGSLSILDLRLSSCRYIVCEGDAWTTRYCGAETKRGPYCEHHAALCYTQAVGPKRRKKRNIFVLRSFS